MENILRPIPEELLSQCSRKDLLVLLRGEQSIRQQMQAEVDRLKALQKLLEEELLEVEGQYVRVKAKIFGKSSEKTPVEELMPEDPPISAGEEAGKPKKPTTKKLSERYPNAQVLEKEIKLATPPSCRSCGKDMTESGMYEESEYLEVVPKRYRIIRQLRCKYRCSCHGDIQTAPALPRITPRGSYSDGMIIDVAASKFCDLIPIERYCAMAAREGFEDLPSNSLIETTHQLADFVTPAVELIKNEVQSLEVLHADETPHRMLEGDAKENWFLWGFSGKKSCYFECRDTRSGDVAGDFLKVSACRFLVTDVFSGYRKAARQASEARLALGLGTILNAYCNAHGRRKFKESSKKFYRCSKFYLEKYQEIYRLESEARDKPPDERLQQREKMRSLFEEMKVRAESEIASYSTKSLMYQALNYFIRNFQGLTLFLMHPQVPIDNNPQERLLRNPVIGRKTWFGTHSKRGAETTAKLFTLIESCKLNGVNPRAYLQALVTALHRGESPFTPAQYGVD